MLVKQFQTYSTVVPGAIVLPQPNLDKTMRTEAVIIPFGNYNRHGHKPELWSNTKRGSFVRPEDMHVAH